MIWDVNYDNYSYEQLINADFAHQNVGMRACESWKYQESEPYETMVSQVRKNPPQKYLIVEISDKNFLILVGFGLRSFSAKRHGRDGVFSRRCSRWSSFRNRIRQAWIIIISY